MPDSGAFRVHIMLSSSHACDLKPCNVKAFTFCWMAVTNLMPN